MQYVFVTSSKTPQSGMNTVKVEAKIRKCLVQQDAYVVPSFVFKIKRRVPDHEITVKKVKTSRKGTMPRQNKARQNKGRFKVGSLLLLLLQQQQKQQYFFLYL